MRRATGPNSGPSFSTQPGSSYLIVGELKVLCTCLADLNLFDDTMLFSRTVVVFRMTCVAVHTDGHLAVRIARIRQSRCSMSDCPAQWLFPPATKMAGWCGETCRNPDTLSLNRRPPTQRSFWIQSVAAARFDRIFGKRIALVPDVGGVGSPCARVDTIALALWFPVTRLGSETGRKIHKGFIPGFHRRWRPASLRPKGAPGPGGNIA